MLRVSGEFIIDFVFLHFAPRGFVTSSSSMLGEPLLLLRPPAGMEQPYIICQPVRQ